MANDSHSYITRGYKETHVGIQLLWIDRRASSYVKEWVAQYRAIKEIIFQDQHARANSVS